MTLSRLTTLYSFLCLQVTRTSASVGGRKCNEVLNGKHKQKITWKSCAQIRGRRVLKLWTVEVHLQVALRTARYTPTEEPPLNK